jgi:rod shape-determining protein MreC
MESVLGRYRNLIILVGVLFLQVLGLAVQVKRSSENESTRLIRIWTVAAVTPLEKSLVWIQSSTHNLWHNYLYLRGVRQENRDLKAEIERLRLEQVRLNEDAQQARRLQALLAFKEQYIAQTIAAQVVGSSGSEQSRAIYIDKGNRDGVKPDMAVITADGVVGKVLRVFHSTSQVLLINDQSSGVGAILEKSRLQGVLRGTPAGEVVLEKVMSDEQVQPGEPLLTSGGDGIFPKGMPVGTVTKVSPGPELFLSIRVKPAVNLGKLEEVLVITQKEERAPTRAEGSPMRAVDILAQRLPSVPDKPPTEGGIKPAGGGPGSPASTGVAHGGTTAGASAAVPKPGAVPIMPAGTPVSTDSNLRKAVGSSAGSTAKRGSAVAASPSGNATNENTAPAIPPRSAPGASAATNKVAPGPDGSSAPPPVSNTPGAVKPTSAPRPAPSSLKVSGPGAPPQPKPNPLSTAANPQTPTSPQDNPQ